MYLFKAQRFILAFLALLSILLVFSSVPQVNASTYKGTDITNEYDYIKSNSGRVPPLPSGGEKSVITDSVQKRLIKCAYMAISRKPFNIPVKIYGTQETLSKTETGSIVTISGKVQPFVDLYIDNKKVDYNADGTFEAEVNAAGKEYIPVESVDPLGNTVKLTYGTVMKNEPVPAGTVVIGDKAYALDYANDISNYSEIRSAIANSYGVIYVKKFNSKWIDNNTNGSITPDVVPSLSYKDKKGNVTLYNPGDGTLPEIPGIDVSKWQGQIDWKKVKAAGIKFAMIRVGYAQTLDPYFHSNISSAIKEGIDVGVYLYSYATNPTEAKKEAEFVVNTIKGYKITYPVAFDIEDKSQENLSKQQLGSIISSFCSVIKNAGYIPMLYSNLYWLRTKLDYNDIKDYEIWLAQWALRPTYVRPYRIWQYSSEGRVDGINGNVDLNISFKDYGRDSK